MTNATYATPQVEDQEMGKVKEIFDRALNAMVNASTLAKDVDQLKTDLDALKATVTHYRNTIANQDDQITRLRQDRDAARTAQYQAEDNTRHQATELENVKREAESLSSANVRLNDRISEVTKERDEAQFKLLELTEAHAELSKTLDSAKDHMMSLFNLKPELVKHPVVEPEPSTVNLSTTPVALSTSTGTSEWPDFPSVSETVSDPEPPVNPPEPSPAFPEDIKR